MLLVEQVCLNGFCEVEVVCKFVRCGGRGFYVRSTSRCLVVVVTNVVILSKLILIVKGNVNSVVVMGVYVRSTSICLVGIVTNVLILSFKLILIVECNVT